MTLNFNNIEIEDLMNIIRNFNEKNYLDIDIDNFGNVKNLMGEQRGIEIFIDYRYNDYKDVMIYILNELKYEWEDVNIDFDDIEKVLKTL